MSLSLNPPNTDTTKFKVAAVQAEPAWCDLQGGVDKTIRIIREASSEGAKIIGFPELFIPGYPWTLLANNFVAAQPIVKDYHANALSIHSPEMNRIQDAVHEADVTVVLGFAEHAGGSLYIAQVTITPDGKIANYRRKLKATHYEKTIFGDGNGKHVSPDLTVHHSSLLDQSIYNVVQTPYGRLASLNCWEHIQPWFKTHMYSQYPQLFVASWPAAFPPHTGGSPYSYSSEACTRMSQFVAIEGGCFGLVASTVISEKGAERMRLIGFPWFKFPGGGFSVVRPSLLFSINCCWTVMQIYGPDGSALTEPVDAGVEAIVYADISLDKIAENKIVTDIMGNYSRFDLLSTAVHGRKQVPCHLY
ncbi:carbon-nitrogen hydrolase [Armillaria luteobubalina]|uniref:Carbon-nitrogen hydrolase n=1 Tax=Armillaria luteobubalina TaxID=153913 RepID=A0AA39UVN2_9AGAR|nr:carbon-nitrogen hydrolase [Armillaria luteobubalina]